MDSTAARKLTGARFQLLLRIKHPTLDTVEITREFQIEPEHAANAGEAISPTGRQRLHAESYWVATLPSTSVTNMLPWMVAWAASSPRPPIRFDDVRPTSKSESFKGMSQMTGIHDAHILAWLGKLEAHRTYIKDINDTQGSVTLVLQRERRDAPLTITPHLAQRLADLGIRLEID